MSHQQGNQSGNAPEFSFFSSSFSLFFLMWQDGYLGSVRAAHQDTQLTSPENRLGSQKRKRCEDARSLNVTPQAPQKEVLCLQEPCSALHITSAAHAFPRQPQPLRALPTQRARGAASRRASPWQCRPHGNALLK